MDIDRFKKQHVDILDGIASLRRLAHAGVAENAQEIARRVTALSSVVTMHLAIEDRILYPALQHGENPQLAAMGKAYQDEMKGIASSYIAFSRKWGTAATLVAQADEFRQEANRVLKTVYDRMQKENTEFYPAIEAS